MATSGGTSLVFCIKLQEEEINLVAHDSKNDTRNISFKEEEINLKQVSCDGSHAASVIDNKAFILQKPIYLIQRLPLGSS